MTSVDEHVKKLEPSYVAGVLCLVTQSCPALCDSMDCSPPGSSVRGNSPSKKIGMGCHALLQGIFPTQSLYLGLLHCRRILYHLSHQKSPNTRNGFSTHLTKLLLPLFPQ